MSRRGVWESDNERESLLSCIGAHVFLTFRDPKRGHAYVTIVRRMGSVVLAKVWGRTKYRRIAVDAIRYASVARVTSFARHMAICDAQRRGVSPMPQNSAHLAAVRRIDP